MAAGAAGAKAGLLDDPARRAALQGRDSWGDPREAVQPWASLRRNWELHFTKGLSRDKYARQLDFFGIELAVVLPGNKLTCVRNLSKAKPEIHTGAASAERRCYLTWSEGDLGRADADLLARAGISTEERVVLKLLPPAVEAKLAELETNHAGREIDNVRKTRFGIRAAGDGYEFFVLEQFRKEQATK